MERNFQLSLTGKIDFGVISGTKYYDNCLYARSYTWEAWNMSIQTRLVYERFWQSKTIVEILVL
jgi:hypothetical protein